MDRFCIYDWCDSYNPMENDTGLSERTAEDVGAVCGETSKPEYETGKSGQTRDKSEFSQDEFPVKNDT